MLKASFTPLFTSGSKPNKQDVMGKNTALRVEKQPERRQRYIDAETRTPERERERARKENVSHVKNRENQSSCNKKAKIKSTGLGNRSWKEIKLEHK